MHEYAQDAMTYVRVYGRPDLFITFTCNPTWDEIKEFFLGGLSSSDRHDITARVFKQKLKSLMDFIVKHHVFGETRCWMYSIEWQKRGLPHAHILIWLIEKITPDQIDQIISAEIPDVDIDPDLFEVVTKNMIHGPCGLLNNNSPCMSDRKCTKRYSRDLLAETITGNDGYPLYRRRSTEDGGKSITLKVRNNDIEVDNRWVVPYSPLLSKTFKAHINVEYCNSVKSIKYICKYVNKGSDMAVFGVGNATRHIDEIDQYQVGRYISSNEAVWRILSFPLHERHPTVVHLAVHLENGQRVYFTTENVLARALSPPPTTLTAFFSLCSDDMFAKTLLYSEVPTYYTWNASAKKFQRRKQGKAVEGYPNLYSIDALGRLYTVHPNNTECFYL
ncbi:ATP-dependent DNA helicase [Camponotus japonicus]